VNRTKLLIPAVVAVAAIAAFYFLALSPKRDEIAQLDTEIAAQQAGIAQSEQQVVAYGSAKKNYRANYTKIVRLGKAVPADDDVRSLLVQLDDAAARSKVKFRSMNVTGGGSASDQAVTPGGRAPAPGTVSVGSAGFTAMPFTFGFSGSFFTLSDFFRRLERFVTVQNDEIGVHGRLLLLSSIAVTPDTGDLRSLQAQIGAVSYLVPPAEGLDGASAGQPAPGTAESDTGGTTPNTTASITGVR
jgi:hypothetical protein